MLAIVDVERIRARRFHVVLDANCGAGAVVGGPLLDALGCDVQLLGGEPIGRFLHEPEPTQTNLKEVCQIVAGKGADVGFCQDPDADRLAVIDASGRYIGEEFTLALCAEHVLRQTARADRHELLDQPDERGPGEKVQCALFRTAVGEANVVDAMLERGAVLGGEGNGGVIDPRVVLVRDSMTGMAQVLDAMAASGQSLAELVDAIPATRCANRNRLFPPNGFPPHSPLWKSTSPMRMPIGWTACVSTGTTPGCSFAQATPSRFYGSCPKSPTPKPPTDSAAKQAKC